MKTHKNPTTAKPFIVVIVATVIALAGGCAKVPAPTAVVTDTPQPTIAAIAAEYSSYRRMTGADVVVNPELSTLCIGVSRHHVERARKTKGPHAHSAIRVFMNDSAAQTFTRGSGVYAPGAVIAKQKTLLATRDAQPATRAIQNGVGGMVKRAPGFDPAHGDWEYFYFDDATKIESGRIVSCRACHEDAKKTDYVFGTWATRLLGLLGN